MRVNINTLPDLEERAVLTVQLQDMKYEPLSPSSNYCHEDAHDYDNFRILFFFLSPSSSPVLHAPNATLLRNVDIATHTSQVAWFAAPVVVVVAAAAGDSFSLFLSLLMSEAIRMYAATVYHVHVKKITQVQTHRQKQEQNCVKGAARANDDVGLRVLSDERTNTHTQRNERAGEIHKHPGD